MFIHKRIDPATMRVTNHSPTCQTAIFEKRLRGRRKRTAIHNIYLAPVADKGLEPALGTLDQLEKAIEESRDCEQVVLGDFNAWHEDWFGEPVPTKGAATRIKHIMETNGFNLWLPRGVLRAGRTSTGTDRLQST